MRILYLPNQDSQQRQHEKKRWVYPIRMAMEATYRRKEGHIVYWDKDPRAIPPEGEYERIITEPEGLSFLHLPHADRVLTDAKNPKWQQNGNFMYHPATYILSAQGCWWHKCRFCVESKERWKVRPVDDVVAEIFELKEQGFREVFDDSGTFPTGEWLESFCKKVKGSGMVIGCNMRMVDVDYEMMKEAGFRMILFGIESANEFTLQKIHKGVHSEDTKYVIKASLAGLDCHGAFMWGFPWESESDAERTLRLAHYLLRKGFLKTAQASFYCPEKHTPSGQKDEVGQASHKKFVKQIYRVALSPEFWYNQLKSIRNIDNLRYLWKGAKACLRDSAPSS